MEGTCAQRVLTGQGLQERTGYKAIREVTGLSGIFLASRWIFCTSLYISLAVLGHSGV